MNQKAVMGLPKSIEDEQLDPFRARRPLLSNDAVRLWYHPDLKIVHHRMLKRPSSEQFRELLTRGLSLVNGCGASKWLSDDRGNTVLKEEDEQWSNRFWLPQAIAGGFKYWAIVLPAAAAGKLNMHRLSADHARKGVISKVDTDPDAAFKWLQLQGRELRR